MLLDAASLYFRAFYGVPTSITTPDGRPINAVRGFLDMTARLLTTHGPDRLVACWDDDWRPAFRVEALPSYKAHRVAPEGGEEVPDELSPQVPILVEVLAAAGIDRVGAPGYEADDVIGTLATRARRPVDVVTGDRDLFQLVDDARGVRVLYTARGIGDIELVDEAAVAAKYGIPRTVVPRPPLTAALLKKLHAAADYLDSAPVVVAVAKTIDLPPIEGTLPRTPADPAALGALAERHGLDSSLRRLGAALGWPEDALAG